MKFFPCQSDTVFLFFDTLFGPTRLRNMAGKKKAFLSPPKKLRKTERRVGAPALSTPPARRQPSKLAPSVAQSPDGSPATPRRQPDNLDELEGRFQEALNNLDESLSTVAPVLKLMFVTLLAALPNRAPQPLPQTPGAETKRLGKDLRAHARESLGLVIKGGICVENKKKRSRFGQAIRTVKRAAWQRACVEGWMLDNGVDSTAQEGLHGVMRSYSNNVDQAAGDRSHFVLQLASTPTKAAHVLDGHLWWAWQPRCCFSKKIGGFRSMARSISKSKMKARYCFVCLFEVVL